MPCRIQLEALATIRVFELAPKHLAPRWVRHKLKLGARPPRHAQWRFAVVAHQRTRADSGLKYLTAARHALVKNACALHVARAAFLGATNASPHQGFRLPAYAGLTRHKGLEKQFGYRAACDANSGRAPVTKARCLATPSHLPLLAYREAVIAP